MKSMIEITGQEYLLEYDYQALCLVEKLSHKPITELSELLQTLEGLAIVLWAGLQKYANKEFSTLADLKKKLDISQIESIYNQVTNSLELSLGGISSDDNLGKHY